MQLTAVDPTYDVGMATHRVTMRQEYHLTIRVPIVIRADVTTEGNASTVAERDIDTPLSFSELRSLILQAADDAVPDSELCRIANAGNG